MNEFWGYFLPKAREILGKCMANAKDLIPVLCRGALVGVQVQAPRTGSRTEIARTMVGVVCRRLAKKNGFFAKFPGPQRLKFSPKKPNFVVLSSPRPLSSPDDDFSCACKNTSLDNGGRCFFRIETSRRKTSC